MVRVQNPETDITKEICDEALFKSMAAMAKKSPSIKKKIPAERDIHVRKLLAVSEMYWAKGARNKR